MRTQVGDPAWDRVVAPGCRRSPGRLNRERARGRLIARSPYGTLDRRRVQPECHRQSNSDWPHKEGSWGAVQASRKVGDGKREQSPRRRRRCAPEY
jgi:hypothetical protein